MPKTLYQQTKKRALDLRSFPVSSFDLKAMSSTRVLYKSIGGKKAKRGRGCSILSCHFYLFFSDLRVCNEKSKNSSFLPPLPFPWNCQKVK